MPVFNNTLRITMRRKLIIFPIITLLCYSLSGCIAAALGAGAAGGYYFDNNYKVSVDKKSKQSDANQHK